MAYTATIDEYQGDAFNYRAAGFRDAPGVLGYTIFQLAQGSAQAAYGALSSANDLDVYRLGWLVPGVYTLQVKAMAWQSNSTIAATYVPSLQMLDELGLTVPQASSNSGSLSFTVSQPGDYQVRLASPTGAATQYQLSYTFSGATPNVAANVVANMGGTLTEGQALKANYSFSDANGTAQVSPDIQWYAYNASTQRWQPMAGANEPSYVLTAQDVGKWLAYTVSFVDNQGYLESKASTATSAAILAASVPVDTTPPLAPRWSSQSAWHYTVNPCVTLTTSLGVIELELFSNAAAATVDNWLAYVNSGFLDGLIFHRVIQQFMIQGGGFDPNWIQQTDTYAPVVLESSNGLSNLRGTLAMARTSDPNSATSQFFINQVDNLFLNFDPLVPQTQGSGYAVFGHVVAGMAVVDQIAAESTATIAGMSNVPTVETLIQTAIQSRAGVAYTATGSIAIDAIEATGSWTYSLDAGKTWVRGVGHALSLAPGHYAANSIWIRQWDAAGNPSASDARVGNELVVDVISPHYIGGQFLTDASASSVHVFTFSESLRWGLGSIGVCDNQGAEIMRFASDSTFAQLSGQELHLQIEGLLHDGVVYHLQIPAPALLDLAGNVLVSDQTVPHAGAEVIAGHVYEWKNHTLLSDVRLDFTSHSSATWVTLHTDHDGLFTTPVLDSADWSLQAHQVIASGDMGPAVITIADALAALKLAAGRNPNADGSPVSPYQFIAADVNGDGRVTSADALAIFKMALGTSDAPAREWLFVDEGQDFWNEKTQDFSVIRSAVNWSKNLPAYSGTHNLVAVLKGDVDGSWAAPAGAIDLDAINSNYFIDLAAKMGVPLAQWGVWAV